MSTSLSVNGQSIPAVPAHLLDRLRSIETAIKPFEHTFKVEMEHVLHAGMYARTCRIAPGMLAINVLIKVPTVVIFHGHGWFLVGDKWQEFEGYNVVPAEAGRKNICVTLEETEITMIFPTNAKTVEEAENEMSDEAENLLTRRTEDTVKTVITGVELCRA